jgi:CRISPR-associated protein Cas5h
MADQPFVVFEVASDMAHFRRQYAITTALTYVVPPRTALCGLVGAILGLPKNDCLREFTDDLATFGLQIVEPIRTGHVSINLVQTKDGLNFRPTRGPRVQPHTTMRYEVVKSPRYRVIFGHQQLAERLAELLGRAESYYTPCLGLAWMIAWLDGGHVLPGKHVVGDQESQAFCSPVRTSALRGDVRWHADGVYQRIRMPAVMQPDRQVTRYEEYIVDTTGQPVETSLKSYWRLADGTCCSPL